MAFHRNWIGILEMMPHYLPQARAWREDDIFFSITGMNLSTFNAAIIDDERLLTPERIEHLTALFEGTHMPYSLQIFSPDPHLLISDVLQEYGYFQLFSDPLRFREGPLASYPQNAALRVKPVISNADRDDYSEVVSQGFDLMPSAQELIDLMLRLKDSYHVLAWLNGRPIGAGTLVPCQGVCGVYNVTTLPTARRRGVGAAVMEALHQYALAQGYPGTALASSSMGLPLYDRLGYQPDGYQIAYVNGNGHF